MDPFLESLLEMGFPQDKAEKALRETGSAGVVEAMEWLISHENEAEGNRAPDQPAVEIIEEKPAPILPENLVAHSYKCEDCGKLLRNQQELEFHCGKTNHVNFSESEEVVKALTEEEKRQRLADLQLRLKNKREEKEEEKKKNEKIKEMERRKTGQEVLAAKQKKQELEMKKMVDDRKREKKEDALAKQRILEQIKLDREAKKQATGNVPAAPIPAPAVAAAPTAPPKNYDECRIQIRMLNGATLLHTFNSHEPLSAVRLYAQLHRTDDEQPFDLITTFPKRVYNEEDMQATLQHLGLPPAAVLLMVRKA